MKPQPSTEKIMPQDYYALRRRKLVQKIKKRSLGAFLVSDETNVKYLTGFTGDSTYLIVGKDVEILVSDSRYTTQLQNECPRIESSIKSSSGATLQNVAAILNKLKLGSVGFESGTVNYALWASLQHTLKSTELIPHAGIVEDLRAIKDASEIKETREAIRLAEKAFALLKSGYVAEMTELRATYELESSIRRFGGKGNGFDPIVAVGANSALPHAPPTEDTLGSAPFFLVDWGAMTPAGYRSDLTRMIFTGRILPKLEKIYKVVLKAQGQAIRAIGPGVFCRKVDSVARGVIDKAGFGKNFGHGLGHGIGLDIHENPRMSFLSEMVLKPGMIVTVEPGIYLPGFGGVRIEDDVLVTKDGCEVLSHVPRQLEDAYL